MILQGAEGSHEELRPPLRIIQPWNYSRFASVSISIKISGETKDFTPHPTQDGVLGLRDVRMFYPRGWEKHKDKRLPYFTG
ncbi:hypothetical protein GCM10007392_22610 [Saccharospirillum salsuginis]|uniref:Uncharacterized protein n=1 Tax=Saccharospirillum salsuginis TaxID=418750 RepID=A0A918N8T8_9GAMM|nr:hypothetical protein GCM10007392_22610 [Saccharospirillum salsuginis]